FAAGCVSENPLSSRHLETRKGESHDCDIDYYRTSTVFHNAYVCRLYLRDLSPGIHPSSIGSLENRMPRFDRRVTSNDSHCQQSRRSPPVRDESQEHGLAEGNR